jgi:hypothetical protein
MPRTHARHDNIAKRIALEISALASTASALKLSSAGAACIAAAKRRHGEMRMAAWRQVVAASRKRLAACK